jgi:hypothetical protein
MMGVFVVGLHPACHRLTTIDLARIDPVGDLHSYHRQISMPTISRRYGFPTPHVSLSGLGVETAALRDIQNRAVELNFWVM